MKKSYLLGNKLLSYVISILFGQKITDVMTDYKVFRRKVFDDLEIKSNDFRIEVELVSKILEKKYRIIEVSINYTYRKKRRIYNHLERPLHFCFFKNRRIKILLEIMVISNFITTLESST